MYLENFEEHLITENMFSRPGMPRALTLGAVWHYTGKAGQARERVGRFFELLKNQDPSDGKLDHYGSAPLIVDRTGVSRTMDITEVAYHCGGTYTPLIKGRLPSWCVSNADKYHTPNMVLIGIEMCIEPNGSIATETFDRAADLGAWLTHVFNFAVESHYRHFDITGKLCPKPWVDDPSEWDRFRREIARRV